MELGSGTASKTRALLYAMAGAGPLRRYVPFDVDESVVEACAIELVELYPGLCVHGVVGDFGRDLEHVPDGRRRLFAFLGGTIGNLYPAERAEFLSQMRDQMGADDRLVIGTDLVKDRAVLEAAYNDSAGVTADFNRNVLRVVNDGLDADFEPEAFEHVAFFDEANSWVEMRLRANGAQRVLIDGADLEVTFADGEEIRTEISAKFTEDAVERELGPPACAWTGSSPTARPVRTGVRLAALTDGVQGVPDLGAGRHPQRAVEPQGLAVEHRVLGDLAGEGGVLLGAGRALAETESAPRALRGPPAGGPRAAACRKGPARSCTRECRAWRGRARPAG